MSGRTVGLAVAMAALAIGTACGGRYRGLPRNVRESVHRDYPDCRGRHVRGEDLGGGRYHVVACGLDVVYACATGPHSRWQGCQMEGNGVVVAGGGQPIGVVVVTSGREVPPAYAQAQPQPLVLQTQPAEAQTVQTQTQPAQTQPAQTQPAQPAQQAAAQPSTEQVEGVIRQWLDSQRATILGCTQTQAALVEVAWTDAGVPTIALGGEMHGSPGEGCVAQQLAGVQFQNVGRAGQLRHVIQ